MRRNLPFYPLFFFLVVSVTYAQGFGKVKKHVTLHRKLPRVVHLTGTGIKVKVTSSDSRHPTVAQHLREVLEAELMKNDQRLTVNGAKPDVLISCALTNVTMADPQTVTKTVVSDRGSRNLRDMTTQQRVDRVSGSLNITYRATEVRSGRVLDSDNVVAKYLEEFDQGGEKASKSWHDMIKKPLKMIPGKQSADESTPPSQSELEEILVQRAASQIAARLVNTDEAVSVNLARGKLDSANKLAESGLWNRMLETLETTTPFPKREDDAYRLYNIAVAYEALAYNAEDLKTARKFFEQAAINYGKAIDARPDEKYFVKPQNRIQTAIAHYKKLEQQPSALAQAPAPVIERSVPSPTAKGAGGPLTNDQVIQLAKAGLDEDNLIATIKQAPAVQFNFSVDAQVQLVENGVKGKVLSAMRERAQPRPARRPRTAVKPPAK